MSRRDNINFLNFFIKFLFYIWKFHLESFVISNMKILNDFDNHLGQINCLENEKIRNQKKRHAGTISIFWFFHKIPILYLKISSGIICISTVKILNNILGCFIALTRFKSEKSKFCHAGTKFIFMLALVFDMLYLKKYATYQIYILCGQLLSQKHLF